MSKIKVIDAVGSESETYSEFELDVEAPVAVKKKINREIGEFIVEQILQETQSAKSPVSGESWPALSKDYKAKKVSLGLAGSANMELTGQLKDELRFKTVDGNLRVGFFGTDEAWKADGHLKFSGAENETPKRRFLPAAGQSFKSSIQDGIENIIADNLVSGGLDKADLEGIETKSQLYAVLKENFGDLSKAEIAAAITRNPDLVDLLDELDLLELL